ncbi:MAG: AMP-binding protein [Clostridia bacterium]|nr:AMP-binding protein [Clostridia bacterium]
MNKKRVLYEAKEYRDIREMLKDAVNTYPDNIAFIIKEKKEEEVTYKNITYKMLQDDINRLGTALIDLGLEGKRIAIIANNRYEWCLAYLATLCGVGIVVPLDKSLPAGEIESLLQRSYANAVVFENKYSDIMEDIKQNSENDIEHYICMDEPQKDGFISLTSLMEKGEELLKSGDTRFENTVINPEIMNIILFTSGTTSASKAVMLSQKNIVSNIHGLNSIIKIYQTDRNLAFLPLHHTFGSTALLFFISNGVTNVFCDGLKYIQKNLQEYNVTVFVCVPLLLEAMNKKILKEIDRQGKTKLIKIATKVCNFLLKFGIDIRRKVFKDIINNLGGLRMAVSGAAAIDKTVAENFTNFGIETVQGYGLTETSPVITAENDQNIRYGSVGFPLKNVEIKIDEPNEQGIGEIVAKGPNVMLGYFENEEATKEVLIDGWFHTGDLGYIDKDGFLFITGRKKNVIVMKNGKNIYPEELEVLISKLPYVAENMVFGIPTKDDDLDLAAKIVYNKEYVEEIFADLSQEELKEKIWQDIKQINKTMPPYKYIREIIVTDEPMIKTTTQKVKRFEEIKRILEEK